MKTKLFSLFFALIFCGSLFGQFQVGKKTITYQDPDRSDRNIETVIYYPATTAGTDAAIASGTFPVIVFGHGFSMANPDLYQYIWNNMVPEGFVCLFPTTEAGGLFASSNHEAFGLDLKFLNTKIQSESSNASSFFYQKITNKTAIVGHSMGGKSTYIAAANNTDVTTIISLTAAMGDPPIGAGYDAMNLSVPYVVVPSLVIDTEFDCVVPEDEGHQLIYDALVTSCKTYVNIKGGGHCYMASSSSVCEQGEGWLGGNCTGSFTITREQQNATVISIIKPYLKHYLQENTSELNTFLNFITSSNEILYSLRDCQQPNPQVSQVDIYNQAQNISVEYGTALNTAISMLTPSISIRDTDNQIHVVSLSWTIPGYNANSASGYNAVGTFTLPAGVDQTNPATNLSVSAVVTVLDQSTSITAVEASKFSVYPNPAKEILFYVIESPESDYISIFSITGSLVKKVQAHNQGTIDISDLSSGIYVVKFREKLIKLSVE